MELTFEIPWLPTSKKNRYRVACVNGKPRIYKDKAVKADEAHIGLQAMNAQQWTDFYLPPETPYTVEIVVYRPSRKQDIDNIATTILDALKGGVTPDDKWCDGITVRHEISKVKRVEVKIKAVA